jgi:hypothetical protein
LLDQLAAKGYGGEDLYRELLDWYGLKRLTEGIHEHLDRVLALDLD